jgi:hypothetical protein
VIDFPIHLTEAKVDGSCPVGARFLADGLGLAGVSAFVSGWGSELFFKVLCLADNGRICLRKGAQGRGFSVLRDSR